MDPLFDFRALTSEKKEKIIKQGYYVPGLIIISVLPMLSRLVLDGEGLYPILWTMTFSFFPAVFTLMVVMLVRLAQRKSIAIKKIFKWPLLVFYLVFLVNGYRAVMTIDQQKQDQIHHHEDNR